MKKHIYYPFLFIVCFSMIWTSCEDVIHPTVSTSATIPVNLEAEKKSINDMLDSFNVAASNASYDMYFDFYTDNAIFIGTDATEHWDKQQFKIWAKPYFDKKKTWHFTSMERHIYFSKDNNIAWFDELLNTQMKICRGSGVVEKINHEWKISQYVLSMTIPNMLSDKVTALKAPIEDSMIMKLLINP